MTTNKIRTFVAFRPDLAARGTHTSDQMNPPDAPQFEGVVFSDGHCVLRWCTAKKSTSTWNSLSDMLDIHGHSEYGTYLVWDDGTVQNYVGNGKFEPRQ